MVAELADLLSAVPARATSQRRDALAADASAAAPATVVRSSGVPSRAEYLSAALEHNALGKSTAATRRSTLQRLSELYGIDPLVAIFRVLRRLWEVDHAGRPLLALLCALARDPLLRATADVVLPLEVGTELPRVTMLAALRRVGGVRDTDSPETHLRFNTASLDKIARNTASSWAQSGHLQGRVRKLRRAVTPTPGTVAFALWLGSLEGLTGDYLLTTLWAAALDAPPNRLFDCVLEAKQLGLLRAVTGGGVREIDVSGLDPLEHR